MTAADGSFGDYTYEGENVSEAGKRKSGSKPMVADPVKLHLATWLVSVTTAVVALWTASFALLSSDDAINRATIQQDMARRVEVLEGEVRDIQAVNATMLRDAIEARERAVQREERANDDRNKNDGT